MADADDSSTANPRKRKCVTLAQHDVSTDSYEKEGIIVIGSQVSQVAVRRSALLSGMEHTEGLASLPAHLSPEDVNLWNTACTVSLDLTADELVTVLKVRMRRQLPAVCCATALRLCCHIPSSCAAHHLSEDIQHSSL